MKVRLMRVYNPYQHRKVWIPRELYEGHFASGGIIQEDYLIKHMVRMSDLWNLAESRKLRMGKMPKHLMPIRPENKPRIYWHTYGDIPGVRGYWRVRGIPTPFKSLRRKEQDARVEANTYCSRMNAKLIWDCQV